uniref:DNA polymerase, beta domain protein region n=1 Tax=Rhodopseudomonas palustris (strain BisA53) TaxID=316055 RepID=Q07GZ7_RHOP5
MENPPLRHYDEDMTRDDVIATLKETEPALRQFGVAALFLFGSHARNEARSDSDVDVFVDVAPGAAFGLRPYMGAFRVLDEAFAHKAVIGYSTRDALSPYIRADVERDALRIF